MVVGYARMSTSEQISVFKTQRRYLADAGVGKLYAEQASVAGAALDEATNLHPSVEIGKGV